MTRLGPPPRSYALVKRVLDVMISAAALIVLAPLLVFVALAVKLEFPEAPVLFRQTRSGRLGRRFQMLKFRTMKPNADELKESLRERSAVAWPDFRLENDPRVTRLGRRLRKTSIDELPQLWSVLRGDMTLVGPRPTSFDAGTYAP
jgi:lipopolysaccharide/colanic/teichoic acid biosynthesis glycosyltransferase